MQARPLGDSSVRVSPVIFGAWAIGGWMWGGQDEQEAISAIHAALDNGITTIDTAAVYGMGASEELVGQAIKRRREKVVIATKCGMRWDSNEGSDPWPNHDAQGRPIVIRRNSKPDSIIYECEQSLKRLGVDVIDLFQIHWPDTTTPIEDSMAVMLKLQQQGKIRAMGVSNYDLDQLSRAKKAAPVASLQPPYSIIRRHIEQDLLPYCRKNHIGVIVYSPLERGLLTGAVTPERKFSGDDHRASHPFYTVENRKRVVEALQKIKPIADAHHASFTQVIINWTIYEPGITAALVGARNAEQAAHNAQAMNLHLSDQERQQIRQAFDETAQVLAAVA